MHGSASELETQIFTCDEHAQPGEEVIHADQSDDRSRVRVAEPHEVASRRRQGHEERNETPLRARPIRESVHRIARALCGASSQRSRVPKPSSSTAQLGYRGIISKEQNQLYVFANSPLLGGPPGWKKRRSYCSGDNWIETWRPSGAPSPFASEMGRFSVSLVAIVSQRAMSIRSNGGSMAMQRDERPPRDDLQAL